VQQPTDICRELLRFGSRQQHAVVQRVQKTPFGDPAFTFDEFLVHHGDLTRRSAEADEAEFEPETQCLAE
jgi:hypothetical protein